METAELARVATAVRGACRPFARYQPLRIAGVKFPGWIATSTVVRSWSVDFDTWLPRLGLDALDLRGRTVLDVGCNAGSVCLEASRAGAREVLGVDTNPTLLEYASVWRALARLDNVWPLRGEVTFEPGDAAETGRTFDVVLCLSVLQHVRSLRRAVHSLAERTGSVLVLEVQTPTPEVPHVALAELPVEVAGACEGETYGHGHFPTLEAFVDVLRRCGFRDVRHVGSGRVAGREVLHARR